MTKVLRLILPLLLIFVGEQTSARHSGGNIDRDIKAKGIQNEQSTPLDLNQDIELPLNEYSAKNREERGEFTRSSRQQHNPTQLSFKKVVFKSFVPAKHFPTVCKHKPSDILNPFDYQTASEYYVFALRHIII